MATKILETKIKSKKDYLYFIKPNNKGYLEMWKAKLLRGRKGTRKPYKTRRKGLALLSSKYKDLLKRYNFFVEKTKLLNINNTGGKNE